MQTETGTTSGTQPQINPLFASHLLNETGIGKAQRMAELFHNFTDELHTTIWNGMGSTQQGWEGREWSIVKTKLEEAAFFAKKAMAVQKDNQK